MHFPLFRLVHVGVDVVLCLLSYLSVYLLRFEWQIPLVEQKAFWLCLPLIVALRLFSNYIMGVYSHLWKYVGLRELFRMFQAVVLGSFLFVGITYLLGLTGFPRSIFVLEAMCYLLLSGGVRFSRRYSHEVQLFSSKGVQERVLIIGAGDAGAMIAADMLRRRNLGFIPVGFIDDNPDKWRARIHDLRVFGGRQRLAEVIENREITMVILAMPSASRQIIQEYAQICQPLPVQLRIVPATHQILKGEVQVEQLRQIQIEDLLGRAPVKLNDDVVKQSIKNQSILVTGAGGSIGSELCRQILSYGPTKLILLGHGENSIYQIQNEIKSDHLIAVIGDIKNKAQMRDICKKHQVQQIFHAAAHKHVPLMEQNITEAFLNNVLGSWNILSTAQELGVQKCVLISTDKAAEPSSMMGLSKYFAELALQQFAQSGSQTKFNLVRFGNVIGSRGSVIPLFKSQIQAGGPITITDPEMTRYFMTIPEAVQLVLQSSVLEHAAACFILDMGEPIRILDLAQNMIRLTGHHENEIEIQITGKRPGEKQHETLVWSDEELLETTCPQIRAAQVNSERISKHFQLLNQILECLQNQPEVFEERFRDLFQSEFEYIT